MSRELRLEILPLWELSFKEFDVASVRTEVQRVKSGCNWLKWLVNFAVWGVVSFAIRDFFLKI